MQTIDFSFAQDPNTLMLALLCGMVPAILWLLYWMHEKDKHSKRTVLFIKIFIGGALAVIAVLPLQQWIATLSTNSTTLTILWAGSEELLKFSVFALFVLGSKKFLNPTDYPLSLMVVALAFAGFENALYFLAPLQSENTIVFALAGTTRFIGTTLLHALASSLAGFAIGFAYYKSKWTKFFYGALGLACGIFIHSIFNILIGQNNGEVSFVLFGGLWILAVLVIIFYELLRRMGSEDYRKRKKDRALKKMKELFATLCQTLAIAPTDESSLVASLRTKGFANKSRESGMLRTLIADLRGMYVGYLGTQGVPKNKAKENAVGIIPDSISARSVSGIITMLSSANIVSEGDVAST